MKSLLNTPLVAMALIVPVLLVACVPRIDPVELNPEVRVDNPYDPPRSIVLFVSSEDARPSNSVGRYNYSLNDELVRTLGKIDSPLRDSVIDGMAQHGFRIASREQTSNRHLDVTVIDMDYQPNTDSPRSATVSLFVRANARNGDRVLSKSYEFEVGRDNPSLPTQSQLDTLLSRLVGHMAEEIVNDGQVLSFLTNR